MTETHNIGEAATLPTTELHTYHQNPRRGDVAAIKDSLATNGQFRPIVVNRGTHTGRPDEVLAGNHTLMAMRQLAEENPDDEQWRTIDAWLVDVDEEAAARIVLADNKTSDEADYDNALLMEILEDTHDLQGTGFDDDDLDDLKAAQEEVEAVAYTPPTDAIQGDETEEWGEFTPPNTEAKPHTEHAEWWDQPAQEEPSRGEATRMFAIAFPLVQFVWVQEALGKWHTDHPDADGANALAVKELLERSLA